MKQTPGACSSESRRRHYRKNSQKFRDKDHKRRRTPRRRFTNAKSNAKRRGYEWAIEYKDFCELIKLPCSYCKGPLPETGHGLDRINNNLPYIIDNVQPCCFDCNTLRRNALTTEETQLLVDTLYSARGVTKGCLWPR